jgi:hypothetical protein
MARYNVNIACANYLIHGNQELDRAQDQHYPAVVRSDKDLTSPPWLCGTLVAGDVTAADRLFGLLDGLNGFLSNVLCVHRRGQWLSSNLLFHRLVIATLAKFVDTSVVDLVGPGLVDVDEEDDVVTQSCETVQEGHLDGESEEVVDEGVEELVSHGAAGHVSDGLEAVVDVQTWDLRSLELAKGKIIAGKEDLTIIRKP